MTDWIHGICDEADRLAAQDPYFQELNAKRRSLEQDYLGLLQELSESDREIITEYVYLVTELAYQKTQAAYRIGVEHQKR